MLAGLGHHAVSGGNHEDCAVHLGCAGDHVLHVVCVSGAVNVRIVAGVAFVFHVGNCDCDGLGLVADCAALCHVCVRLKFC